MSDEADDVFGVHLRTLHSAVFRSLIHDVGDENLSHENKRESVMKLMDALDASLLPCISTIAEYAGVNVEILKEAELQNKFLRVLNRIWQTTWNPPFSRAVLYKESFENWLVCTIEWRGIP